jgi:hypothetical protein
MAYLEFKDHDNFELCPEGEYVGTCNHIQDEFNVERKKFNSDQTELANVTRFTFRVSDRDKEYDLSTKKMKINGHSNSALSLFLRSWLGCLPENKGWDYCELKGKKALLSIRHVQSKQNSDHVFANIVNIMPFTERPEKPALTVDEPPF